MLILAYDIIFCAFGRICTLFSILMHFHLLFWMQTFCHNERSKFRCNK